jgi:hypothetical protein
VQRNIGFEFQAREWQFFRKDKKTNDYNEHDSGRGTPVKSGTGWHLESDGGEPEFVVAHVPETDAKTLNKSMTEVTKVASKLSEEKQLTIANWFQNPPKDLIIKPKAEPAEQPLTADPQMTAGIRYARLSTFIAILSQRNPEAKTNQSLTRANEKLMRNRRAENYKGDDRLLVDIVGNVRAGVDKHFYRKSVPIVTRAYTDEERESVVGILALIASYLKKAPDVGYMKDFPLLAKSNLAIAVAQSPLKALAGAWFNDLTRPTARDDLKEVLLDASGRAAGDYVYPPAKDERPVGPKVGNWIDGLFQPGAGVDRMSYSVDENLDASMGPLATVDTVGPDNVPGPAIELRRINEALPYTEWAAFAEQLRRWIVHMNNPQSEQLDYVPPT